MSEPNPFQAPSSDTLVADDADLASRGIRFVASLLDGVLFLCTLIPAMLLMAIGGGPDHIEQNNEPLMMLIVFITLALMLALAIYNWWLLATEGQTIAKRLLGIRIVKIDGSPVDFLVAVILRSWVLGFVTGILNQCCLGWIVSLVDALFIFNPDRRCLHDHIAGTKVVNATPSSR